MSPSTPKPPAGPPAFPFSPQDALEFMQKMWNPFGVPIPGLAPPGAAGAAPAGALPFPNPAMMFATFDPAELERKIGEMKVVESWLAMTLSTTQMSIKTMEMQKASLEALRAAQAAAQAATAPPANAPRQRKSQT
jgi:hypothetical protein